MQQDSCADLPAETRQVLQDARRLHERLLRLLAALMLASEMAAELLDKAAADRGDDSDELTLAAERARRNAHLYRDFARRLT